VNAAGSFVEAGLQQINVRAVGLLRNIHDIEQTVVKTQSGTPIRIKDVATVSQGPKIRLGQIGKAIHRADGKAVDNGDVVEGIVLLLTSQRRGIGLNTRGHSREGEGAQRTYPSPRREDRSISRSQQLAPLYDSHGAPQPD
jgi:cobalt-zinc-cadmium resistance protein CzcA